MAKQAGMEQATIPYIGRFAPSPTGPLHFGSLLAAVVGFVDARAHQGRWLLRMEDLDPPREPAGAAGEILSQLWQLSLEWDGEVLYQSSRLGAYEDTVKSLGERGLCYPCDCTRRQVKAMGSVYNGRCRTRTAPPGGDSGLRLKTESVTIGFDDLIQGPYQQNIEQEAGDFIIRRKDTLFAYQLAVVVDDAFQQISHVIRGYDLIDSTPRQIFLQRLLGFSTPRYGHIPVIVNESGRKLSKQHFAEPVDIGNGPRLIHQALKFLGLNPPAIQQSAEPREQLDWALRNWDIQAVPKLANIPQDSY